MPICKKTFFDNRGILCSWPETGRERERASLKLISCIAAGVLAAGALFIGEYRQLPDSIAAEATADINPDTGIEYANHLVNGDFEYYHNELFSFHDEWVPFDQFPKYLNRYTQEMWIATYRSRSENRTTPNLDQYQIGWQVPNHEGIGVYQDDVEDNRMGLLVKDGSLYQDIATIPGATYKWSMKHGSLSENALQPSIQVLIGAPSNEQAQKAHRDTSNGNDEIGDVGAIITTDCTDKIVRRDTTEKINGYDHCTDWYVDVGRSFETYSGIYTVPAGQMITRFTFANVDQQGRPSTEAVNAIDDVSFSILVPVRFIDSMTGEVVSSFDAPAYKPIFPLDDASIPSHDGYFFAGYLDADGNTFDFDTDITAVTDIYLSYTREPIYDTLVLHRDASYIESGSTYNIRAAYSLYADEDIVDRNGSVIYHTGDLVLAHDKDDASYFSPVRLYEGRYRVETMREEPYLARESFVFSPSDCPVGTGDTREAIVPLTPALSHRTTAVSYDNGFSFDYPLWAAVYSDDLLVFGRGNIPPQMDGKSLQEWWRDFEEASFCDTYLEGNGRYEFYSLASSRVPWKEYAATVKEVRVTASFAPRDLSAWFAEFSQATFTGLDQIDTSRCVSTANMFVRAHKMNDATLAQMAGWDMSANKNTCSMFHEVAGLVRPSDALRKWDISSVRNTQCMFHGCSNLIELDLSAWDTSSLVRAHHMMGDCGKLEHINVSGWDTSNLLWIEDIFAHDKVLRSIEGVGAWNVSKMENANTAFYDCPVLDVDVRAWKLPATATRNAIADGSPSVRVS